MSTVTLSPTTPLPRIIQRFFEIALYLMVLSGFATLASTGALDKPAVLLVGAALFFRGFLLARQRALLIPERWTTFLTLGYMAFYLADYFLLSGDFLSATVHLVLFVLVVRLYSARRDRDYYFLCLLAFLMVVAATVLTVGSLFLFSLAAFMLTAVATFILMEMRRSSAKATIQSKESDPALTHRRMALWLAGLSPALLLLIFLGAAAIFFFLPRISAGYLSTYAPGGRLATGFSDHVELGGIGEIQQSRSVLMHIRIDGDQKGAFDLKWRGVALNIFDGRTWSNSHEAHPLPRLPDGRFSLRRSRESEEWQPQPQPARPIHYVALMEPSDLNIFFLAANPEILQGSYRRVAMDGGGAVFNLDTGRPVALYEAWSDIAQPAADDLRIASDRYPPEILLDYLQLPPLDPRIPELAGQIAVSARNSYDKAAAIESYLRTHYAYTLQLPRTDSRDPLAHFLFDRKRGHCEYFASSMAVMLRTLRIPARVVNGFRTGEFNDLTSQYLVRASNAHSWVEVYFPDYGWVSFDPTPVGADRARASRVMLYLDALSSFWREWIVNYDVSHQRFLGEEATRRSWNMLSSAQGWFRRHYRLLLAAARRTRDRVSVSPVRWSIAGILLTGIVLLAANARRMWQGVSRWRLAARPEKAPVQAATVWYERMTHKLARRGWRKRPEQTPEEFIGRIQDPDLRDWAAEFTQHYESARFGGSAEAARQLPELYHRIPAATRQ